MENLFIEAPFRRQIDFFFFFLFINLYSIYIGLNEQNAFRIILGP